jgi:hypothetical protein
MKHDEIEQVDLGRWHSAHLAFTDDGPWQVGAKTRQYSVYSRSNRSLMGYVKWWRPFGKYAFIPLNSVFSDELLRQIAQFCKEATDVHMARLPNKRRVKNMEKARRQKRIEELALTKKQKTGSIDSVSGSCVPEFHKTQVVEGVTNLTPLEIALGTIEV